MASESTTVGRNEPISRFSLRRKSIQMTLALVLSLVVSVVVLVQAIASGHRALVVVASVGLALALFANYRNVHTGLRVVAVVVWIRKMGEGDLDYTVNLSGNDEVNRTAEALERLRQRSIEALQLDLVRKLFRRPPREEQRTGASGCRSCAERRTG